MMKIKYIPLITSKLFFLFVCFGLFVSCSKDSKNGISNSGISTLRVSASIGDFSSENTSSKMASTSPSLATNEVITNTIKVDENLFIVATLTEDNGQMDKSSSSKLTKMAAIPDLGSGIWYKLLVFKTSTGNFIDSRNYQRGNEGNAAALQLDGGTKYTFVAYSVQSAVESDLPEYTPTTLTNSTIEGNVNSKLLYFKVEKTISGEATDYLSILFQRKNSQVTVVIDADTDVPANNTIEEVLAEFRVPSSTAKATLNLGTGTPTWSTGAVTTKAAGAFSTGTRTSTSTTELLAKPSTVDFFLTKYKIGPVLFDATTSGTPKKPFATPLVLNPGRKYLLKLVVKNAEEVPTIVVPDAGTWMRHNLGANTSLSEHDPVREIIGHYFQWGKKGHVATAGGALNSLWSNNYTPSHDLWVDNVRTTADPCPTGYRIPTKDEFQTLVTSPIFDITFRQNVEVYLNATILTSKTDPTFKITFPTGGYRKYPTGDETDIGVAGMYWTASIGTYPRPAVPYLMQTVIEVLPHVTVENRRGISINYGDGLLVRCIKM